MESSDTNILRNTDSPSVLIEALQNGDMQKNEENLRTKEAEENSHLFVFTAWKAGTETMSEQRREEVKRTVYEMSKNSKYFQRAQENDKRTQQKIKEVVHRVNITSEKDLLAIQAKVNEKVKVLESERDLSQTYAVIDMDMFFAAVEIRDNPQLQGKPVAVGGMSMISTANYEARKYGVRSAMPGFIAKKLCPDLVFVNSSFDKYIAIAKQIQNIFLEYDPDMRATSLDEAYIRITNAVESRMEKQKENRSFAAQSIVSEIRRRVFECTQLTCSAGIGPSRMLAKVASDFNKPNGQYYVEADRKKVLQFLWNLNVRKIPGIGKVTEKILTDAFKVNTVKDLYEQRYLIHHLCTRNLASFLLRASLAVQANTEFFAPSENSERKSISIERTFRMIKERSAMYEKCYEICCTLASQMREKCLLGTVVTLKLKATDFKVTNRQVSLRNAIGQNGDKLFETVLPLLRSSKPKALRLMGVKISGLINDETSTEIHRRNMKVQPVINKFLKRKEQEKQIECPVCSRLLPNHLGNQRINEHIDLCLNQGIVRNLNRQKHKEASVPKKLKRSVTEYFK